MDSLDGSCKKCIKRIKVNGKKRISPYSSLYNDIDRLIKPSVRLYFKWTDAVMKK